MKKHGMLLHLLTHNYGHQKFLKKTGLIFLKNQLIIRLALLLMVLLKININTALLSQSLKQEKTNRVNSLTGKFMSQNSNLHENCSCLSCQQLSETEKKLHLEMSQNSRREFFKNAGKLGLRIGIGGGLISPLAASALASDESNYKEQTIKKNKALQNGKAQMLTLLHTAD